MRLFNRLCLAGILTLCMQDIVQGQGLPKTELYNISHVPPEAASLGKYGVYPVGLYTGVPNIQIPFYEVNVGRIKIPIAISYHAAGIRVEEIASSVGLGWALQAGGVITHTVKGLPDEQDYIGGVNFFTDTRTVQNMRHLETTGDLDSGIYYQNYLRQIVHGDIDGEPDSYSFNFGSYSGEFAYHQNDHRFYSVPYTALKIEKDGPQFNITTENGIVYHFGATETSVREAQNAEQIEVVTSFYLSSISDPSTGHEVYFEYLPYVMTYPMISSETHTIPVWGGDTRESNRQTPTYQLKRLKKIIFDNGMVLFEHGKYRCDLPGDSALTDIKVYNNNNLLVKNFHLNQDFFYTPPFNGSNSCDNVLEAVNKRLKLISVEERPVDGSNATAQVHQFEYNSMPLPSRLSFSQDHWGYYNGKSNTYLYPPVVTTSVSPGVLFPGGDRTVDTNYTQAGILKKIYFPTGGRTEFQYENNTAVNANLPAAVTDQSRSFAASFGGGGQGVFYSEAFSVFSTSCTANNQHEGGGAYVNFEISGIDVDMIQTLGFPGKSADIRIISFNNPAVNIQIVRIENGIVICPQNVSVYLPNDNYYIQADFSENPFPETYEGARVNASWTDCLENTREPNVNGYTGGLRIKQITSFPDQTTVADIKTYKYYKENDPTTTSGLTHFFPNYSFRIGKHINGSGDGGANETIMPCLRRFSQSTYPLTDEGGKTVGYSNVIESDGVDGSNGYTQHKFTNYDQYDDVYYEDYYFKYNSPGGFGWLRGLELGKTVFKKSGNQDVKVAETINEYDISLLGSSNKKMVGIRGGWFFFQGDIMVDASGADPLDFGFTPMCNTYEIVSDFPYLKKTTERVYNGNNYLEKISSFTYNSKNLLPLKSETLNSDGTTDIITRKYPLDYIVDNPVYPKAQAIANLQQLNNIAPVIEQYLEKKRNGTATLKQAIFTSYKPSDTYLASVDTIFRYETPLSPLQNYGGVSITSAAYLINPQFTPEIIAEKYGPYKVLLQQKKNNDFSLSYLWNYQYAYPVCEVKNATQDQVAYTSFEGDDPGNWTIGSSQRISDGVTGGKCYQLANGSLNKDNLAPSTEYIVSYWIKSGSALSITGTVGAAVRERTVGDWKLFVHHVTGVSQVTISGSGLVDEARLYPKNAQMTTYSYEPLLGMTSQCDVNDRIIHYEYDGFGRLSLIRDQDNNILKKINYSYAGQ